MNQKPFQRVSFEWLSKTSNPSEEIEKCDFGARGQVAYAMPPEYGKGHYEAFELTLGMNFVKSTFQYSPTMRGKSVPMMEVKAEYTEPSVRMLFLRGLRGNVKVENPTAQLLSSPGEDIFHYTTGFRANYVADGSHSGEIISFSIGRTVLNQLIGDEVAESLLVQLGIADLPSITKHPIPLHISQIRVQSKVTGRNRSRTDS